MPLSEERRSQLDGIVTKMASQNAPKEAVQSIVNDFKSKYENEQPATPTPIADTPSPKPQGFIQSASDLMNRGIKAGQNFGIGQLKGAANTVLSMGQLGSKALESGYNATIGRITGSTAFDGARFAEATKQSPILQPQGIAQNVGYGTEKVGEMFAPTGAEEAGASLASKVASALPKAEGFIPKAANALTRVATGAGAEALDVGAKTAAQTGSAREGAQAGLVTGYLGAGFRGVDELKRVAGSGIASRIINSLIKPTEKEFRFGKNPGLGVAKEGITANSLEDLRSKVSDVKGKIGKEISQVMAKNQDKVGDASKALEPLDKAMQEAAKGGKANATILQRLQDLKDAFLHPHTLGENRDLIKGAQRDLARLPAPEMFNLKRLAGDQVRWTNNPSEDTIVNSALKKVYDNFKKNIETVVPEAKPLNERYANLVGAESAARRQAAREERKEFLGVPQAAFGILGSLASLATGHGSVPTIAAGITAAAVEKAFESPAVKTRLADWFASTTPQEKARLYKAAPQIYSLLVDGVGNK